MENKRYVDLLKSNFDAAFTAFQELGNAMRGINIKGISTPKVHPGDPRKNIGKTRPGAIHKVNPTFLSRPVLSVTPTYFRHAHMGRTSKRWERSLENGS